MGHTEIGDVDDMLRNGNRQPLDCAVQLLGLEVTVDLGHRCRGVAQEPLDLIEGRAILDQPRCERVAQAVEVNLVGEARSTDRPLEVLGNVLTPHWSAVQAEDHASVSLPTAPGQQMCKPGMHRNHPVPLALGRESFRIADEDHSPFKIDVLPTEGEQFAEAQARQDTCRGYIRQ